MQQETLTLVLNPGSTTTKIAIYQGLEEKVLQTIDHERAALQRYASVYEQLDYRFTFIKEIMIKEGYAFSDFSIVMGRGGLLHPLAGGVYEITPDMIQDLKNARYGEHPCNLGAPLALKAVSLGAGRGYIADPVVVDELIPEARVSGLPELPRKSIFHALNQKIAAREVCEEIGKPYDKARLIVAHLGGGISIGVHYKGKVIDVNNALDGDGPFSPERSGGLPAGDLVRLSLSGRFTPAELQKLICGNGGIAAYLGTSDVREIIEKALIGDEDSAFYLRAMLYQVSKEIGALSTVLHGDIDAIVLTGGMTKSDLIVQQIKNRVSYLAPVHVIPGEREMLSLAENAIAVRQGVREVNTYELV